jgi:hypothetical protein
VLAGRPVITYSCNLLHDVVDVLLYAGKILEYLNWQRASSTTLVVFAASYLWFRLINFGLVIYSFWFLDVGQQDGYEWAYNACRVLVFGLILCHLWWFYKILRIALRGIFHGSKEIRDARSDDAAKEKAE